jgi:hypothetical protein
MEIPMLNTIITASTWPPPIVQGAVYVLLALALLLAGTL